jgi:hypothetical protein
MISSVISIVPREVDMMQLSPLTKTLTLLNEYKLRQLAGPKSSRRYQPSKTFLAVIDWKLNDENMTVSSIRIRPNKKNAMCCSDVHVSSKIQRCCSINHLPGCCSTNFESPRTARRIRGETRKDDGLEAAKKLKKKVSFDPKICRWNNCLSQKDKSPIVPRRISTSPAA